MQSNSESSSAPIFEEFTWPILPNSPKKVKSRDFFNKTYELLSRSVTPEVKTLLGKGHPLLKDVIPMFSHSAKIYEFVREMHEEYIEETTLSPVDLSKLSMLLVDSIKDGIIKSIYEQLLIYKPKKRSCKNLSPLELKRCILGLLSVKSKSTQLLLYR